MKKFFIGFAIAWNMLTLIPLFKIYDFKKGYNAYACISYGMVGFILGSIVYFSNIGLSFLFNVYLAKILSFILYVLLYGALHLDGLLDSLDAIFLKAPKEKLLSVLKDPHVGSFAVIFGILFIIGKLALFLSLKNTLWFIIIASASRFSVVFAMKFFPYISNGMASQSVKELKNYHLLIGTIITVALCSIISPWAIIILGINIVFALFIGLLLTKKFFGLNGDMYGLLIELGEFFMLLMFCAFKM